VRRAKESQACGEHATAHRRASGRIGAEATQAFDRGACEIEGSLGPGLGARRGASQESWAVKRDAPMTYAGFRTTVVQVTSRGVSMCTMASMARKRFPHPPLATAGKLGKFVLNYTGKCDRAGWVGMSGYRGSRRVGASGQPEIRTGLRNFLETPFIQRNEARPSGDGFVALLA
jgi:hypothetical protein